MRNSIAPVFAALLLCAGCVTWEPTQPYVVEVKDEAALKADFAHCVQYALDYHQGFDIQSVGVAALAGAISNIPAAALAPGVIALGAAENAGTATINGLAILPTKQQKILVECLREHGNRSQLYMVIDPGP